MPSSPPWSTPFLSCWWPPLSGSPPVFLSSLPPLPLPSQLSRDLPDDAVTDAGSLLGHSFPAPSPAVTANAKVPLSSSLTDADRPFTCSSISSHLFDPLRRYTR